MPELARPVAFFSVDPGETVSSGLERVVGQYRAERRWRVPDDILIARPIIVHGDVDWNLPRSRSVRIGGQYSVNNPVHVRLQGAFDMIDVLDTDNADSARRHFFAKTDDPNLMTQAELDTERAYILYDMGAARRRVSVQIPWNPLMERGDYVLFNDLYWTIDSFSLSLSTGTDGVPQMQGTLTLNGAQS